MAGQGAGAIARQAYQISGSVQGVGFRPFVYRLATELNLSGWVRNTPAGVELELQGDPAALELFGRRLPDEVPPLAVINGLEQRDLAEQHEESGFSILPSGDGRREVQIAPDTALCPDCRRELFDPADRRFRHPFISCTNCGPRFTIVTATPYDRPLTTMAVFPLCPACQSEYDNPADRRFHAQPIACPICGPRLSLIPDDPQPVSRAAGLLQQGLIVAVKGLGGFHLAVDAASSEAVARLRQRKQRDEKPFAVMVPDLATARMLAQLSPMEERLLSGPEAPIVIVRRRPDTAVSPLVAPGSQWIGLVLAYTPLHQLLFAETKLAALVMTSANPADQPMISEDEAAVLQLAGIADALLTHDRPIQTRTDDSVLRAFRDMPLFYRRSRGYVPRPVLLCFDAGQLLAVGAELKNTICVSRGDQAFLSQHIGDLKNEQTFDTFRQTIDQLRDILA
ncbi:MAG: carbamoyltransferase HypF, partial [Geobacter sp.]